MENVKWFYEFRQVVCLLVVSLFLGTMQINGAVSGEEIGFNLGEGELLACDEEGAEDIFVQGQGGFDDWWGLMSERFDCDKEKEEIYQFEHDRDRMAYLNEIDVSGLVDLENDQGRIEDGLSAYTVSYQGHEKEKRKKRKRSDDQGVLEAFFKCIICEKILMTSSALEHSLFHIKEKPFMCCVCGKSLSVKPCLIVHIRIHTGEKPYACKFCEKKFAQSSNLTAHTRIHTKEKPFCCEQCGKEFNQKGVLNRHERLTHKKYGCQCGKKFMNQSDLNNHIEMCNNKKSN